jgi:hypothetical protein
MLSDPEGRLGVRKHWLADGGGGCVVGQYSNSFYRLREMELSMRVVADA